MMSALNEELALARAQTIARARDLCKAWAYWCIYGRVGEVGGWFPFMDVGGMDRRYRAPPQWYPASPRMPEADENIGMAVQRAYIEVPEAPGYRYRTILRVEFCRRPWVIGLREGEIEERVARAARVSIGVYDRHLERALLSLVNVMKRKGLWRE